MKYTNKELLKPIQFGRGVLTEQAYVENSLDEIICRLDESMGINDDVERESQKLSEYIRELVEKKQLFLKVKYQDGTQWCSGTFIWPIFEFAMNVTVECFYYENEETYQANYRMAGRQSTYVRMRQGKMSIQVDVVNNKVKTDSLEDSVQHEIEHAFQDYMSGSFFEEKPFYQMILSYKNSNDDSKRIIGHVLYLSHKPEQEGFANGLYAFLKQEKPETRADVWRVLKEENAMFKEYLSFKHCIEYMQNHSNDADFIVKIKNIGFKSYQKFNQYVMNGFDWFNYRMHRSILRYEMKRDADRSNQISEYIERLSK